MFPDCEYAYLCDKRNNYVLIFTEGKLISILVSSIRPKNERKNERIQTDSTIITQVKMNLFAFAYQKVLLNL